MRLYLNIRKACVVILLAVASNWSGAATASKPAVINALEKQGLLVFQEFDAGSGLRGFAAAAGENPVAVYVTRDGKAIVGTRLDVQGKAVDDELLGRLVAKPLSDKTWSSLAASKWVADGKSNAPQIVYVFTDPSCPYCHRFWEAVRPWVDAGKVQLRHIIVGIIREDSPTKAAAIFGAENPAAALLENERKHESGGVKPAKTVSASVKNSLDHNQKLMLANGFRGTPGIIVRDRDGLIKKYNGQPQQEQLLEILGPR